MCKKTWGIYPWFIENGAECINPLDLERFKKLSPYGKVFECIAKDHEYIVRSFSGFLSPDKKKAVVTWFHSV